LKSFGCSILPSFFLFCIAPCLAGDPAFSVAGVVHDASGARISHAHIAIHGTDSGVVLGTETGEQGDFVVAAPGPGSYQVEVTAEGFSPLTTQVILTEQLPSAKLDLALDIAVQAETVEVTGYKED
jgi:hypothetical protein